MGFFACLATVALTQANGTLYLIDDKRKALKNFYRMSYKITGALMILLPLAAWITLGTIKAPWLLFAVEAAAITVFAIYWMIKTVELMGTGGFPMTNEADSAA